MLALKNNPLGAAFTPVYHCCYDEVERILDAIGKPEAFDIIFHNDEVNIYRVFWQTGYKQILEFNLVFIAQRVDADETPLDDYLVTSGTIRTSEYLKEPQYEKVGKRLLYRATLEQWNTVY